MTLKLKAQIIVTGKCTSASKHPLVKTLKNGDVLEVSTKIQSITRSGSWLQATTIDIRNLTNPSIEPYFDSMTMASKLLSKIPHTVIDND